MSWSASTCLPRAMVSGFLCTGYQMEYSWIDEGVIESNHAVYHTRTMFEAQRKKRRHYVFLLPLTHVCDHVACACQYPSIFGGMRTRLLHRGHSIIDLWSGTTSLHRLLGRLTSIKCLLRRIHVDRPPMTRGQRCRMNPFTSVRVSAQCVAIYPFTPVSATPCITHPQSM